MNKLDPLTKNMKRLTKLKKNYCLHGMNQSEPNQVRETRSPPSTDVAKFNSGYKNGKTFQVRMIKSKHNFP